MPSNQTGVLLERKDASTVLDWQLLPCPFCGKEPTVHYEPDNPGDKVACSIGCRHKACPVDVTVWSYDAEQAVADWNTRAVIPPTK